jgi:cytochrome b6-f complex iron-sulfur subunit
MNRKEFLRFTALAAAGAALGGSGFLESCKKADTTPQGPTVNFTLDLTQSANSALNSVGGYVYSNGLVIARTNTSTFIAIASTCTHNGCTIQYNAQGVDFVCPCHGGTYNLNGEVIGGPPTIAVKNYTVTRNGNILTIKG